MKSGLFKGDFGIGIELDTKAVTDQGVFEGYGSTFNNVDQGWDVMMPGAFKSSLEKRPASRVKMLLQHDAYQPCGVWSELKEDSQGLYCKGQFLMSTTVGRETYEMVKAGALDGLSIGFRTLADEYDRVNGTRKIKSVDLREISVVTFPMNEEAQISSVKHELPTEREFEDFLVREAKMSRQQAKVIIASGYKTLKLKRDAESSGSDLISALRDAAIRIRS
jgi:HK97 family phage prohead protease